MRRASASEFAGGDGRRHAAESYLTQRAQALDARMKNIVAGCELRASSLRPPRIPHVISVIHTKGKHHAIPQTLYGGGRDRGDAADRGPDHAGLGLQPPRSAEHHALARRSIPPTSTCSTATSRAATATSRCSPTTSRCRIRTAVLTISRWIRRRCTRSTSTTTATRAKTSRSSSASPTASANDNRGIKLNIGGPQVAVPLKNVGGVSAADSQRSTSARATSCGWCAAIAVTAMPRR